jgi:hypothetical protein
MTKSAVKSAEFIQDAEYHISQGLSTTVYMSHGARLGTMEDYTMALINRFKYYPNISNGYYKGIVSKPPLLSKRELHRAMFGTEPPSRKGRKWKK